MSRYLRTNIISFYDLPETAQISATNDLGEDLAIETMFVKSPTYAGEYLPLCNFMRAGNSCIWSGVYGTSYFSGYYIAIGKDGEDCVVADRWQRN